MAYALNVRHIPTAVIRDPRGIDELRAGWDDLAREAAWSPMQHAAWAAACAATVDAGLPLQVVVAGNPERPSAVAPLVRRAGHLELLGASTLSEPADFLYEDTASLAALAHAVAALRAPLLLHRIPAGSPTVAAVSDALRPLGVAVARRTGPHAAIALDASWTRPEGALSARRASDVRRARRRAGDVDVELLAPAPADVEALLEEAFAIEARSWKGHQGTALAADSERAAFFRAYGRALAADGALRIAFLRVGGERVAMQVAVEAHERRWLLKIGHDEAFGRCSPGTLLLLETVRDAAARGLEAVQLLGEVEPWTAMWTDAVQECVTFAGYPPRVASLVTALGDARVAARRRRRP
jgi:CelD/BcsL family acetyltransferase involved in cellulose biosynthesis